MWVGSVLYRQYPPRVRCKKKKPITHSPDRRKKVTLRLPSPVLPSLPRTRRGGRAFIGRYHCPRARECRGLGALHPRRLLLQRRYRGACGACGFHPFGAALVCVCVYLGSQGGGGVQSSCARSKNTEVDFLGSILGCAFLSFDFYVPRRCTVWSMYVCPVARRMLCCSWTLGIYGELERVRVASLHNYGGEILRRASGFLHKRDVHAYGYA